MIVSEKNMFITTVGYIFLLKLMQLFFTNRSTFWSLMVLVPIMGINWIVGIFAVSKETVVFQFLFAIFNSFQVNLWKNPFII